MKYRVIKAINNWKVGETFEERLYIFNADELVELGFFEKVEEKKKPKFKVGDYAVCDNRFMKIMMVKVTGETFLYDGCLENRLRTPTKEELELYFR